MKMSRWGPKVVEVQIPKNGDDVVIIDTIEWADPTVKYSSNELAQRPKPQLPDPCGCSLDSGGDCCKDEACVLFACQEECYRCLQGCKNRRIQQKQWKKVEVFDAGPKGKGLRVLEDVRKGEFIIEYVGRAIRKAYLERLFSRYKTESRLYIMALDGRILIDARKRGGLARYINHSCDPNCVVQRWRVFGIIRACIFATRDIEKGEEISFDYRWERRRGRAATKCHCYSPMCRGTLEVSKSTEEEELERQCQAHWFQPSLDNVGFNVINRTIRVFSEEHQEYFTADVCKYDEEKQRHLIMYRGSLEEVWENLSKERWELLDEQAEQFVIARKKKNLIANQNCNKESSSLVFSPPANTTTVMPDFVNYFYVTTEIKNELHGKGFIANVGRQFRCSVETEKFIRPEFPKCKEEEDRRREALSSSPDGVGWKLTISGANVLKACTFVGKNIAKKRQIQMQQSMAENTSNANHNDKVINLVQSPKTVDEAIVPRCVVDSIKKKLPGLRERYRNVNFQFSPSESKSKQFARFQIEGTLASDVITAREHLWNVLLRVCDECQAPKTSSGFYKHLGFYGGQLSPSKFQMLLNYNVAIDSNRKEQSNTTFHNRCHEAHEDLRHRSSFFPSFESTHRCIVWVQAETDMGRIEQNRVVNEYNPSTTPRKVFLASAKIAYIPKLWTMIEQRANDLAKGIRYFHLGRDRMYQQLMIKSSGRFFEYLQQVTGAMVSLDSVTGDHLRIDGGSRNIDIGSWDNECVLPSSDLACLTEEIIRLQIELYRDHCIRQQSWIFGRDWSLATAVNCIHTNKVSASFDATMKSEIARTPSHVQTNHKASRLTSKRMIEPRNIVNGCLQVAEIVKNADLIASVGAHAVVILYRFFKVCTNPVGFKLREIVMACLFLANKAQKQKKWRRLEVLLQVAYPVFFPGSTFHREEQEATNFEQKVLAAEKDILDYLEYDIFWKGIEWIVRVVIETGNIAEPLIHDTINMVLSGPVLAAGCDLWLKYGVEYIFTAVAGFLTIDIEPLFESLSLIPLKVSQAAQLIAESVEANGNSQKSADFNGSKQCLREHLKTIKQVCLTCMTKPNFRQQAPSPIISRSLTSMRHNLISQNDNGRIVFAKTSIALLHKIVLPQMNTICAESQCRFYVEKEYNEKWDQKYHLVLIGGWRALSIAKTLLIEACANRESLPTPSDISFSEDRMTSSLLPSSKARSGLLSMKDISTLDGWEGTIQDATTAAQTTKAGGKACVVGRIPIQCLRTAGLRWWNQDFVSSLSAEIYEVPCLHQQVSQHNAGSSQVKQLANLSNLALLLLGKDNLEKEFPKLSFVSKNIHCDKVTSKGDASPQPATIWAISMQRWPPEKIDNREQNRSINDRKNNESATSSTGFSPAALQELQLLTQLHKLIPSPTGHPNFTLPIGVAIPAPPSNKEENNPSGRSEFGKAKVEDIFSLFRSSEENERQARKERKRQDHASGPHLIFAPTPFVLTRILQLSNKIRRNATNSINKEGKGSPTNTIPDTLLSCWFHDMLSALVHCHSSYLILRSVQTDQIFIDHSGVVKFAGFYRATVMPPSERDSFINPIDFLKSKKENPSSGRHSTEEDDSAFSPYTAPELLMGSMKHTKETDIWAIGSTIAHLLLGKPLFVGKERSSLLISIYKIVGSPSAENYPDALVFPLAVKVEKKIRKNYKRAVKKAFEHMMKPQDYQTHEKAIDLIALMLHLDPEKRISVVDALQHDYLQNYIEQCSNNRFQERFVHDWRKLKRDLLSHSTKKSHNNQSRQMLKRKNMLEAAEAVTSTVDLDGLYDMQDMLASASTSKRRKPLD